MTMMRETPDAVGLVGVFVKLARDDSLSVSQAAYQHVFSKLVVRSKASATAGSNAKAPLAARCLHERAEVPVPGRLFIDPPALVAQPLRARQIRLWHRRQVQRRR
jgi:hypothetical protein